MPQTIVLRYAQFEPPERRMPQAVEDYSRWFMSRLRAVTAVVSDQPYLCGDRFTIADIAVAYALLLAKTVGFEDRLPDAVKAYRRRMTERPAFLRARDRQRAEAATQGIEASG